ncbi:MAG: glycosyltransferase, partial [Burkholderiaceae bacterium]
MNAPVNPSDFAPSGTFPAITRLAQCLETIQSEKASHRPPRVSVCISVYNHAPYIGECIDSVLAQSYPNVEIIVIDDASTDASFSIASEYARLYPGKVQAHRNTDNLGPSMSPNRAFKLAQGEFIALLGSDDRMLPERLAKQVQFLQAKPDHVAVLSQIQAIDANGQRNSQLSAFESSFNQPIADIRGQLIAWNVLNAPSALIRADKLHAIDGYSPLLRYVQDYDLWIRLLETGDIGRLEERLTEYRVHDRNLSVFGSTPPFQARAETAAVILRAARRWPVSTWIPASQDSDRHAEADAQLRLATHLARVDYHFFKRPVITTAHAYELTLAASEVEPERAADLKASLETWLDGGQAPAVVTESM